MPNSATLEVQAAAVEGGRALQEMLSTMNKQEVIAALRTDLARVAAERLFAANDPAIAAARSALKRFQSARMARTHADLLASRDTHDAARFFLDDLYGPQDLTRRDADLERIVSAMERMLPLSALRTVAEAIALDALSESLDAAMAERLGCEFSEDNYIAAYRAVSAPADRARQIDQVESVGNSLCDLVCIPLINGTLKLMRGPARLAKLGELQNFLERGFNAFKSMEDSRAFVEKIVLRERRIMENLYAGRPQPFAVDQLAGTDTA